MNGLRKEGIFMKKTNHTRHVWLSVLGLLLCAIQTAEAQDIQTNITNTELHLAAFGDSITRAFNANDPKDHPWNSWSTGNSGNSAESRKGSVKSHAEYLSEMTGQKVIVHNLAKTGATSEDLMRQVDSAKGIAIDYATMLIGANDLWHRQAI
jgi:lysophospholipase L1-like esterase